MSYSSTSDANSRDDLKEIGPSPSELRRQRFALLVVAALTILVLVVGFFTVRFLLQPEAPTETIRDIFIILLTFEFMILGFALVIMLIQLANLINLLQNEIQPILESTSEAADTLRGTATFLSTNLIGPIIKVNSTIAGLRRAADLFNFRNKGK